MTDYTANTIPLASGMSRNNKGVDKSNTATAPPIQAITINFVLLAGFTAATEGGVTGVLIGILFHFLFEEVCANVYRRTQFLPEPRSSSGLCRRTIGSEATAYPPLVLPDPGDHGFVITRSPTQRDTSEILRDTGAPTRPVHKHPFRPAASLVQPLIEDPWPQTSHADEAFCIRCVIWPQDTGIAFECAPSHPRANARPSTMASCASLRTTQRRQPEHQLQAHTACVDLFGRYRVVYTNHPMTNVVVNGCV